MRLGTSSPRSARFRTRPSITSICGPSSRIWTARDSISTLSRNRTVRTTCATGACLSRSAASCGRPSTASCPLARILSATRRPATSGSNASYAGHDRASDVLQVAEAAGRLDDQVDRSIGWFRGLGRFESYRKLIREDRYLLPRAAIREALVNAVTHRDYAITGSKVLLEVFDGRVDVTSPGALPNHMTVDRVMAGANPRSRNDSMAYFMAAMGYMEQRGRGWLIMRREMRAFNETEPTLMQDERNKFVRVTFNLVRS